VTPKPELLGMLKAVLLDAWKERVEKQRRTEDATQRRIATLTQEKANLLDLKRRNPHLYTDDEFLTQKHELDEQIRALTAEQREVGDSEKRFDEVVDIAFSSLEQPFQSWRRLDIGKKVRFQRWLLPQGLPFDGRTFGTAELSPLLELFQAPRGDMSRLVPPRGIEPLSQASEARARSVELWGPNFAPSIVTELRWASNTSLVHCLSCEARVREGGVGSYGGPTSLRQS
jgi:hypothetical protein